MHHITSEHSTTHGKNSPLVARAHTPATATNYTVTHEFFEEFFVLCVQYLIHLCLRKHRISLMVVAHYFWCIAKFSKKNIENWACRAYRSAAKNRAERALDADLPKTNTRSDQIFPEGDRPGFKKTAWKMFPGGFIKKKTGVESNS